MISIELAKKLSEKGLEWEPKFGDLYCFICREGSTIYCFDEGIPSILNARQLCSTWLPSLSQMLKEIEDRGYCWDLEVETWTKTNGETVLRYRIFAHKRKRVGCSRLFEGYITPQEATGEALLWILEQEGK